MLYIDDIGRYFLMIKMSFFKPSKWKVQRKLIFKEINDLIIESIPIVAILSFFIGGVVAIQTALNLSRGGPSKYCSSNRIASLVANGIPTLIDEKIAGIADHIGYEPDDFEFSGGKRRQKPNKKKKNLCKSRPNP